MPELEQFLWEVFLAAAPVILGWATLLLHRFLATRQGGFYLELLEQTVAVTVKALMTKVNEWKALNENGRLTPQQVQLIQQEAIKLVLNQLSAAARRALQRSYCDVEQVVAQYIEARVYDVKLSQRPGQDIAGRLEK